ncbi:MULTISPECIES: KpsF/GutQ family sugar-phosphate isomerase [Aeromonas]|uniref:Arabinose 5-phosphate isomerase n=1 Tax=Aeromonas caviae TaxID=648 RepID=A0A7T4C2F0_AERCA|nr:KpsF/GutQ family sugar-phosphate isomerase [Aeromonas caviae]QQA60043.1 KpsF/GutQ family sugar-phosphate isomerase [Aeromonas caviae]
MRELIQRYAHETLSIELTEAQALLSRLDDAFVSACEAILECTGKIVVTGIGKSGHIGKKIAATLASTGSPAFFVHPAEALHGDLGMITAGDLVIMISNSGEASEFKIMLPLLKHKGLVVIGFTGKLDSYLARQVNHQIDTSVQQEACPLGLAPTSSAINTLMMGDALAISAMRIRNFNEQDYAVSHPGGSLGARLLLRNKDILDPDLPIPVCSPDTFLKDAIVALSRGGFGLVVISGDQSSILGVFTDGDLRRSLEKALPLDTCVSELMTQKPVVVQADSLATATLELMHEHSINAIPVISYEADLLGVIGIHQIYKAGIR